MSTQTPQMEVFDELRLRQEINGKWGAYGAHAEVYSMLLADRDHYKALCEELRKALQELLADCIADLKPTKTHPAWAALKKAEKDI